MQVSDSLIATIAVILVMLLVVGMTVAVAIYYRGHKENLE